MDERLVIRFDGPPGPTTGRFIEVELGGKSVSYGEWEQDGDDWLLVLPNADTKVVQLEDALREADKLFMSLGQVGHTLDKVLDVMEKGRLIRITALEEKR